MKEIWEWVVGSEGFYKISTFGRVKSTKRNIILKQSTNRGYKMVFLRAGWYKGRNRYVHQLVLEAFVGPCPEGMESRHFPDRDRANNRLTNLRWGTRKQNTRDRERDEGHSRGENNGRAKLNAFLVKRIRILYSEGNWTFADLGRKFKVSSVMIRKIVNQENWRSI